MTNVNLKHQTVFNQSHTVNKIDQICRHKCKQHGEPVKHYCLDCSLMVCPIHVCVLYDNHVNHNIQIIEDYCKEFQESLLTVKSELEENYKSASSVWKQANSFKSEADKTKALIDKACNDMKAQAGHLRDQLLSNSSKLDLQMNQDIISFIDDPKDKNLTTDELVALSNNIQYAKTHFNNHKKANFVYPVFNPNIEVKLGEISWFNLKDVYEMKE